MIIQESLYQRIESLINRKRKDKSYSDIIFGSDKSNTTKSFYIWVKTYANNEEIRMSFRFSDHRNSQVKTKVIKRTTNFSYIERKLEFMVSRAREIRYEKLIKTIEKEKK
jgi:hypothetical protein